MKTKEKRVNLASNSKTETYNEQWCIKDNFLPLSQKAYWVGGKGIFVLFIFLVLVCEIFIFFFSFSFFSIFFFRLFDLFF